MQCRGLGTRARDLTTIYSIETKCENQLIRIRFDPRTGLTWLGRNELCDDPTYLWMARDKSCVESQKMALSLTLEKHWRSMAYDGRAVANFILDFCERKGRQVSNLALQKLVYFCHVWSLIKVGQPLVKQNFEAWEFGPVLPYLYREFKDFDRSPITTRSKQLDPFNGKNITVPYSFDKETDELLGKVVEFYSRLRAGDLVELSHASGGPWFNVWHHQETVNPGMKIDDGSIIQFYSSIPHPFTRQ